MAEVSKEDAEVAASVLLPLVRRVAPGELTKSEVSEQSGLDADEIRAGVALLIERGRIRATEDGWAIAGSEGSESWDGPPDDEGPDDEGPEAADPTTPASVPGDAQGYRATFEVTISYGGKDDDEALRLAGSMEEEIADLVHERYPRSMVSAAVKNLLAYRPRVIFGDEGNDPEAT